VRVPDDRNTRGHVGQSAPHRRKRGHAAAVVAHEHRGRAAQGLDRRFRHLAQTAGLDSPIEPEQGVALRAKAHLLRCAAGIGDLGELDPEIAEKMAHPVPRLVGSRGPDQHDIHAIHAEEARRKAGAAGPLRRRRLGEDGHGCVGTQAVHGPRDVAVEQDVADHHHRPDHRLCRFSLSAVAGDAPFAGTVPDSAPMDSAPLDSALLDSAASTYRHRTCTDTR
jgi:hypothetical protein